jgi:cell division septation protein DedD
MAKKIKKYKVGMDSETFAISLVEEPAIESDFVALSKEDEEKVQVLLESNEKHMVYGAALIPEKDIYRNNGEQEYYINFSKESIEKMSQDFMKEYRQFEVKTDHDEIANEVCVVESWLVSDAYKDKSNALGINVPEGTWMIGMKVNNIDTWDRIKAGELKGFSVESVVSLEEFSKQNDNNMDIKTDEMFWTKLVNVLKETFSKKEETVEEPTEIEPTNIDLEEQTPEPQPEPVPEPTPEPVVEPEPKPEPTPAPEPEPEPEPQPEPQNDNHLEELVNSLKDEIKALKEMNTGLQEKIKDLGKQPSANPINVNAKPSAGDTYAAWREQMRAMIG